MPVMNGFDASIEILKVMSDYQKEDQCRIVALSSYTNIECINTCMNIGMTEYAYKPINFTQLKAIVEKHHYREVTTPNKKGRSGNIINENKMLVRNPTRRNRSSLVSEQTIVMK